MTRFQSLLANFFLVDLGSSLKYQATVVVESQHRHYPCSAPQCPAYRHTAPTKSCIPNFLHQCPKCITPYFKSSSLKTKVKRLPHHFLKRDVVFSGEKSISPFRYYFLKLNPKTQQINFVVAEMMK